MVGLIILGIYVVGYLAFLRPLSWAFAQDSSSGFDPDTEDLIFGVLFGIMAAIVWPISGTIYLLARYRKLGNLLMPRDVRQKQHIKELEDNIRRLERETGVK